MKLYEFLQLSLQTHATYQQLITMEQTPNAMLNGNFDLLPSYTPDDPDGAVRRSFMQKIAARYYNYDIFTVDPNYFGQRMFWKLNTIMPTFQAKFNAVISPAEFEQAFLNGVTHAAEGSRDNSGSSRSTSTGTSTGTSSNTNQSTTEDSSFGSDYPQVAVAAGMDYNTTASQSKGNSTGTSSGSTSSSTENGTDSTTQTTEGWKEKRTRKLTPDEILLAKQKIAKLIINIEEEIVMNCSDLFQNVVDCCDPCEDREKNMVTKMQIELNNKLNAYARQAADLEVAQTAELIATENGVVTPDRPYVGFSKVTVAVPEPTLLETTVTANGTYNAPEGEGYKTINVRVPTENEIITVNELPTSDIDKSKYYKVESTGKLYKYLNVDPEYHEVQGKWKFDDKKLVDFASKLAFEGDVYQINFQLNAEWPDGKGYRTIMFNNVTAVAEIGKMMGYVSGTSFDIAARFRDNAIIWEDPKYQTLSVISADGAGLELLKATADKEAAWQWVEVVPVTGELQITENNTYDVASYSKAVVNIPETPLDFLEVTENGTYVPDEGAGYGAVNVNVPATPLADLEVKTNGVYNPTAGTGYNTVTVDVPATPLNPLSVTANGEYTPDSGTGYGTVSVNVPTPEPELEEKTVDIAANGTTVITPTEGKDGISKATVNVNVPIPEGYVKPEGTKEITDNGEVDVTNFATVNVNVDSSGGVGEPLTASTAEEMEALLTDENVGKVVNYRGARSNTSYGNSYANDPIGHGTYSIIRKCE